MKDGTTQLTSPIEVIPDLAEAQIRARACWYYYVGAMTQQDIADLLGLTRLRVNKIVRQARLDGLVHIDIKVPLASCIALEEKLTTRFALDGAVVVPSILDPDTLQQVIGEAAGSLLERLLSDGMTLGVGWGRTLRTAATRLSPRNFANSAVTSLMGGLTRGSGTNTFEVATEFARVLGAECHYVAAPIYCPSVESRATLLTHYGLAEVMRRAREGNLALVSCGDLTDRSLLANTHIVRQSLDDLKTAGAIGDILGTFIDACGRPVDHPLNQRVMALSPEELKAYPNSILASGGIQKVPVMHGILNAGYVRHVVTDELAATALLDR